MSMLALPMSAAASTSLVTLSHVRLLIKHPPADLCTWGSYSHESDTANES